MSRTAAVVVAAAAIAAAATIGCLLTGAAHIPACGVWQAVTGGSAGSEALDYIVLETRLPAAVAAMLCGLALSLAGLVIQTVFNNPLAGPSILGISTGASLGVALVMLAAASVASLWGQAAVLAGALAGALAVIALLTILSTLVQSATMLLIVGILLGYLASSAIALLNFFATSESVHGYVIWGLGSFNSVTRAQLPIFAAAVILPAAAVILYAKTMNALLLGERYAATSGVNVIAARRSLLLLGGLLTAAATAWCGPIGFLGLVVPHVARLALHSSDHRRLLPVTALTGAATGVVCQWLCVLPASMGIIPVNAVTPIIGVPVIVYIIVRRRSIFYFN